MQDVIEALKDRQQAGADQPSPTLERLRATFTPGARLQAIGDDVRISEVTLVQPLRGSSCASTYSMPSGPIADICVTYSPDLAQWK
jgi:hypothetical protein